MKAESETYQTIFSENGDRYFPYKVLLFCYELVAEEIKFPNLSVSEQRWFYYFLAHGCSGILNQWITGGMVESINEVVDFTNRLIQNNIQLLGK